MSIKVTFYGGFPRNKTLIKIYGKYLRKDISREEFYEKGKDIVLKLIRRLLKIGISIGTDGMFVWDDFFTPFTTMLDSLKADGLYRFFDNNFYLRIPVVEGKISSQECINCKWYEKSISVLKEKQLKYSIRGILPGYALFAFYSDDKYYGDRMRMLEDYHKLILGEIRYLKEIGIDNVEIHDPALTYREFPENVFRKVLELYKILSEYGNSRIWLVTYFRYDYLNRLVKLFKNTEFIIHFDLIENKDIVEKLLDFLDGRIISLGLVDARNTKMEKIRDVKPILEKFINNTSIFIAPNTFLEFIPEVIAYRKLRFLAKVLKAMEG